MVLVTLAQDLHQLSNLRWHQASEMDLDHSKAKVLLRANHHRTMLLALSKQPKPSLNLSITALVASSKPLSSKAKTYMEV